jgi:hypothetical protein
MAAFDTTAATPILKTKYQSKKVQSMAYKKSPALGMIPKDNDGPGDQKNFVMRYARTSGGSSQFGTAQTNAGPSSYKKFAVTTVTDYSVASITGKTIMECKGSAKALVDAMSGELNSAIETAAESAEVNIYGNGGGARAVIDGASTMAGATITLSKPADIARFENGMWVQLASTDGTTGSVRGGHVQITGIDRDLGTLTTSGGNWSTQIPGALNTDFIFREGDFGATMSGLGAWLPASAPGATAFFGVDRTADTTRLGGVRYNGAGGPQDEVIIEAAARLLKENGTPDILLANNLDVSPLVKQLGTKRQYTSADSTLAGIGYRAMEIETAAGPVKIVADPKCPKGTAWLLQMDTWELVSMGDVPHILDLDGNNWLRESGADAYQIRVGSYSNVGCYAPGWNCRITW